MNELEVIGLIGLTVWVVYCMYLLYNYLVDKRVEGIIEKEIKKNINKSKINSTILNFERDIEFLDYILFFKVESVKNLVIQPLSISYQNTFINDDKLDELVLSTSFEIIEYLNDDYKLILSKYFTEDTLNSFITDKVYLELSESIISINNSKIG